MLDKVINADLNIKDLAYILENSNLIKADTGEGWEEGREVLDSYSYDTLRLKVIQNGKPRILEFRVSNIEELEVKE